MGSINDPRMLYAGLGMLSGSGPSLTPVNPFGGALRGLALGQQAMASQSLIKARQEEMERKRKEAERQRQYRAMAPQLATGMLSTNPQTRQEAMQGILGMQPEALPGIIQAQQAAALKRVRPMTAEEKKVAGIPADQFAQIDASGRISMPGMPMINLTQIPAGFEPDPDNPGGYRRIAGTREPTAEERKQIIQSEIGLNLASQIEQIVAGGVAANSAMATKAAMANNPWLSWAVSLSEQEAKLASNVEQLSNIMLAAMRGAAVGPEEQEKFNRQLPRLGQNDKLFAANLTATKENLQYLIGRMSEQRFTTGVTTTPLPPMNPATSTPLPPPWERDWSK